MTEEKKITKETVDSNESEKKQSENINSATESVSKEMRYSGFWVRGAAFIIDSVIITGIVFILGIPVAVLLGFLSAFLGPAGIVINALLGFVGIFMTWGYFIFMTHKYKATLGKMAVGVQVLGVDGGDLSLTNIIIREIIGKFVSKLILGIGYIMAAFTRKKQGLHDTIANSIVTYKNENKGPNIPIVIATYVLFSGIMVAFIALITSIAVVFGLVIVNIINDAGNNPANTIDNLMNGGFERVIEEQLNESEYNVEIEGLEDIFVEEGSQI